MKRGVKGEAMALLKAMGELSHPHDAGDCEITSITAAQGLIAAHRAQDHPILLVTSSSRRADELVEELSTYIGGSHVISFPPWETLPHERLSPKSDTIAVSYTHLTLPTILLV